MSRHLGILFSIAFCLGCTKFKTPVGDGGSDGPSSDHPGEVGSAAGSGGGGGQAGAAAGGGAGTAAGGGAGTAAAGSSGSDAAAGTAGIDAGGGDATGGGGGIQGGMGGGGGAGGTGGAGGGPGGAAGTGGAGGTPGAPLGQACNSDAMCASGHCADGFCCDQACTGPCAQCGSDGHCQMPADDPGCGTIACPADTACRDYATSITVNRCKALGQCKTGTDCNFVSAPAKKYCGTIPQQLICDGAGNCVPPTVTCGGDGECPIGATECCDYATGTACQVSPCSAAVGILCDQGADCPPGYICCAVTSPGGHSISCATSCPYGSDQSGSKMQVCTPTLSGECPAGTTCHATTLPGGGRCTP